MFKPKLKEKSENNNDNNKKKIENIVFLVVVLIITIIVINVILKDDSTSTEDKENTTNSYKTLASDDEINNSGSNDLEQKLESILATIKGVGEVNVFVNYSESNQIVAMYDETTTTSSTEETDSSGGTRDTTSTETQKEVVYSDDNGNQTPVTEKVVMPTIEGAIITAVGASDTTVKTNIISAVQAATGLSIDKIQVFEME